MPYEVELKFPVADLEAVAKQLSQLGATFSNPQEEVDVYFAHPVRDFRKTDEALRIRCKEENVFCTYKGPKIDQTTKTREEIDLPLPDGSATADAWKNLLEILGFRPVGEVHKRRQKAHLLWQDHEVEGSLDEVEGLGTFVELELIAELEHLDKARGCITALANALGLANSERRSYLGLLLEQNT